MALNPSKEGTVPFKIPSIDTPCFTYYKIFGDLSNGSPPLVIIHGGPAAGHEYLLPFANLWTSYGLPIVFYDQIGCASSTHLPQTVGDTSFWQESLFIAELDNLIDHFHLRDGPGFHLLGQSFGGMLAVAFAARRPRGLQRLVLASALASRDLSLQGQKLIRKQLPPETQQAIEEADQREEYDSPTYKAAMTVFLKKHMCRIEPFPPEEMLPALRHMEEDKTVSTSVNGPSLLKNTGSWRGWTSITRLPNINVPTLVYNGEFDTSHDIATAPFFEHIPRVRWIKFPNASHMPHLDRGGLRERTLEVVGGFLTQKE